jgi:hypothetical protein
MINVPHWYADERIATQPRLNGTGRDDAMKI